MAFINELHIKIIFCSYRKKEILAKIVVIDIGSGGTGSTCPKDFAINKEGPFYSENAPFFLKKSALEVFVPPMFEMLPTSHPWPLLV